MDKKIKKSQEKKYKMLNFRVNGEVEKLISQAKKRNKDFNLSKLIREGFLIKLNELLDTK
jgi:hypothetical protein